MAALAANTPAISASVCASDPGDNSRVIWPASGFWAKISRQARSARTIVAMSSGSLYMLLKMRGLSEGLDERSLTQPRDFGCNAPTRVEKQ